MSSVRSSVRSEIANAVKDSFLGILDNFMNQVATESGISHERLHEIWNSLSTGSSPKVASTKSTSVKSTSSVASSVKSDGVHTVTSLRKSLSDLGVPYANAKTKKDLIDLYNQHSTNESKSVAPEKVKMTVSQLREELTKLGVTIPRNAKKSDLEDLYHQAQSAVADSPADCHADVQNVQQTEEQDVVFNNTDELEAEIELDGVFPV